MHGFPQIVLAVHVILGLAYVALGGESVSSNSVLILGDSYTSANNGTHTILKKLFEHAGDTREIQSIVSGGKDLAWHLQQIKTPGTPHEAALGDPGRQWGFVVLQDRSHVPAYCCSGSHTEFFGEYSASLAAVHGIDYIAKGKGARTVFFQTWGRRSGAPVGFLQNFELMNEHVVRGYELYAQRITTKEREPITAPVGAAFKALYDDVLALSNLHVALTTPNHWAELFEQDGSHPSLAGSYLAACTLYAAITNKTPIGLVGVPGLTNLQRSILQKKAHDVVFLSNSLKDIEGQYMSNDPEVHGAVADIRNGFVIWPPSGFRTRIHKIGSKIQMIFHGKKYVGSLNDGNITWSDGDVWTRPRHKGVPGKLLESAANHVAVKPHILMRRESDLKGSAISKSEAVNIDPFGHSDFESSGGLL